MPFLVAFLSVGFLYANSGYFITNTGLVYARGVIVYWESNCINEVTAIDWGLLSPGEIGYKDVYIKSISTFPVTLNISSNDWIPPEAETSIFFSTDYLGGSLNSQTVLKVTFYLEIDSAIQDITDFVFDIWVMAESL